MIPKSPRVRTGPSDLESGARVLARAASPSPPIALSSSSTSSSSNTFSSSMSVVRVISPSSYCFVSASNFACMSRSRSSAPFWSCSLRWAGRSHLYGYTVPGVSGNSASTRFASKNSRHSVMVRKPRNRQCWYSFAFRASSLSVNTFPPSTDPPMHTQ